MEQHGKSVWKFLQFNDKIKDKFSYFIFCNRELITACVELFRKFMRDEYYKLYVEGLHRGGLLFWILLFWRYKDGLFVDNLT